MDNSRSKTSDSSCELENKNLLVVSHQYNQFVKSQVDELSKYFNSITVLARYNQVADFIARFGVDRIKPYSSSMKINLDGKPSNVEVIGVPLTYLPLSFGRIKLGDRHAKKCDSMIQNHDIDFDIVHSHLTWTAGYAGHHISKKYDSPHVITVHENKDWFFEEVESNNEKVHSAWRNADHLIRVNRSDCELLEQFNQNVSYIPNGFDVRRFERLRKQEARDHLGLEKDSVLLFSLGILTERKGFQNVIEVLPNLIENNNVKYVIGGQGPFESQLKKQVELVNMDDYIQFTGYLPNSELKYWMSASDLFVHPSYSESFGLVQLEALACGTPVVAAKNGGSEEVISSEKYGLLFDDPDDHSALLATINEALEKQWVEEELVDYAEQFTIPKVCEEIATLFQTLLDESN
ncbi:glycosyltransferase [Natrialba swarupiae]|uniref:Glycosyltransferase family 4 protein n=1 Tax=Natrialba swarupiae TaxID=2448032 RepID=A0A5D5AMN6_9EURY|nr:glycosyltransferase [Natrialba swarupiae]TYT60982.1 glycosyltransferase family 4 protein [Natrialba swarupiae]